MILTSKKIESTKPDVQPQKLPDGTGLYLYVTTKAKSWRFDYRFSNRRYTITFGLYPTVGLAEARELLRDAKKKIAIGINPAIDKRLRKLALEASFVDTFEAAAQNWFASKQDQRSTVWQEAHSLYLRRDLNPHIGKLPLTAIDATLLLGVLERAKAERGVRTAERARQTAIQVFDHGIRKLKIQANPARLLKGWADLPAQVSHRPLREDEVHDFVVRLDADPGSISTKLCILLMLFTFVRKSEIAQARWSEFDLQRATWSIPPERMKMRDAHVVPLSRQALEALAQLRPLSFGSKFLFPSNSSIEKPMSLSTPNVVFKRMGYGDRFSPHGLRATASTWLNNRGVRADVIERQLAHAERNRIRAAYNHADYMPERIAMMQMWADFIEPPTDAAGSVWIPYRCSAT
ncbi:tyrosine-type recombinase/integrase [Cupriavidus basilensis]|uniref:Tyrosine-type recombinase/integrase n=1 Tax=Cupriavidus basilensis TaxID=68895 RepID=A0ABT6B109_9BURK|nr:tyrosine-type recombinase/integrase [Cupriavidus basilensis]MDF3838555.1 tyrosine-type recombinase/integrase [Cupriavidus basilensis]